MQQSAANRFQRILGLGLSASFVVWSALVAVPKAYGQQEVDPTWYDYRPAESKAAAQPAPSKGKSKPKPHTAARHHASDKARVKQQSKSEQSLAAASAK